MEPLVKPSKEVEPAKWLNVLLLLISLVYAFAFYTTFKEIIHFIGCNYCHFTFVQAAEWVSLAYMPVNLYLLFKRKRWGWILLYANNMFILVTQIGEIHLLLKYQSIASASMLSFFLPIALHIAFALFLWKDNIAGLFNVSALTKKATTVIIAAVAVFFILMMNVFY